MSFISDGIDDYEGEAEAMGFVRYGVSEVRRQVSTAKELIDGLAVKMAKATGKAKTSWDSFKSQWDNFYSSTQGVEGAFTQFKDSTYERTLGFQQRAEGLSKALETAKPADLHKVEKPEVVRKSGDSSYHWNPSIGWNIPWGKLLLWGGISAGGIFVAHKIYRHYTAPVRKVVAFATGPAPEQLPPDGVTEHADGQ